MRSALAALFVLGACHAPAPTTVVAPPTRTVQLRLAHGAQRGKLVLGWLNAEQAERWAKHHVKAQDFVDLVARFELVGETSLDETLRPIGSHAPAEAVALVAVLDPGARFWSPLFGQGGFLGVGPIDRELAITELPPAQRPACEGPRMQALIIDAPETVGSIGNLPQRRFCAWLPKSYAERPTKRYPVVYLLPGFGSNEMAYLVGGNALGPIADQIAEETGREVILVGVDTSTKTGSTYLVDSPISGQFDSFMSRKAITAVDASLRTIAERDARALLGHSTGGFNAISFGLRHHELFSALAASSPDGLDLDAWMSEGGKAREWVLGWMRLEAAVGAPGQMWSYAADWSPGRDQPEWPFNLHSGKRTSAFVRWHLKSPMAMLDGALAWSDRIFVSVGDRDEFGLTAPALAFAEALKKRGAQPTVLVTPNAGHFDGQRDRLEAGLRYVLARLKN